MFSAITAYKSVLLVKIFYCPGGKPPGLESLISPFKALLLQSSIPGGIETLTTVWRNRWDVILLKRGIEIIGEQLLKCLQAPINKLARGSC